jgi:Flp pilus assembly pilin Flp
MSAIRTLLKSFWRKQDGVAAVEFAFTGTIMAGLVVGMVSVWDLAQTWSAAQSAAGAGARYYLDGGSNDATAEQIAMTAWPDPPVDADASVTRACRCGDMVISCSDLCVGSLPPQVWIEIETQGTWYNGLATRELSASQVVRVR